MFKKSTPPLREVTITAIFPEVRYAVDGAPLQIEFQAKGPTLASAVFHGLDSIFERKDIRQKRPGIIQFQVQTEYHPSKVTVPPLLFKCPTQPEPEVIPKARTRYQRVLDRKIVRANSIETRPLTPICFRALVEMWQKSVLPTLKRSNQLATRSFLKNWVLPRFGQMSLSNIDGYELQMFINSVPLRTKTIKNIVGIMRIIWSAGRRWNYVQHDPFEGLKYAPQEPRRTRHFSLQEMKTIIENAQEPFCTMYWLAAETGARSGEIFGLCLDDIDFERGFISVRRSAWRNELREPKTRNANRSFQISPELMIHLKAHLDRRMANHRGLLFATKNGTPVEGSLIVKRKLYPLLDKLGIKRGGFHAFRHGNSTLLDRYGAPMKLRQQRLGHSDAAFMLTTYTHTSSEDERTLVEQLGASLKPTSHS